MAAPKISVIVPVYNVKQYLPRVVNSLKSQSANRNLWEAIFINDASPDGSLDLLVGLTRGERNMRIISHDTNSGLSATRNTGIMNSNGEFIAQLDGDDMLEPEAIERVSGYLNDNPDVKYFYSSHKQIDEKGKHIKDVPSRPFDANELFHYNFISPLKGYARKMNNQIGGFRDMYAEDWDHALRANTVLSPEQFGHIPDSLFLYTMRASSIIHTTPEETKRKNVCDFLKPHIETKVGRPVKMFWSGKKDFNDGNSFNYYDWEVLKDEK